MVTGVRGALISHDYAERLLGAQFAGHLGERDRRSAADRLLRWWRRTEASCGPASNLRIIAHTAARPLAEALGFVVTRVDEAAHDVWTMTLVYQGSIVPLVVLPWISSADAAWRSVIRCALLYQASWCLVFNGVQLRIADCRRTHARRHLDFELPLALEHGPAFTLLWALLRAPAFDITPAENRDLIAAMVDASDAEGRRVSSALRGGVRSGIEHMLAGLVLDERRRRRPPNLEDLHGEALTAVYRLLFLLFAEARRLVPTWHPIYRESYSIDALRRAAAREAQTPGIWEALQAIGRLAHKGCRADDLDVTAFNGRLFSPLTAPRLETARLGDETVRQALLAVSTVSDTNGGARQRIAFGDLGVEELGSVYEGLLDYEPRLEDAAGPDANRGRSVRPRSAALPRVAVRLERTSRSERKATGTFYTPALLTRHLVQQTLEPLVEGLTAERILDLRICDPAMGSGAFLVAACRHLAEAYESALIAAGTCTRADLGERERADFRRLIARRCLFGVDLNPMAVQLARLSLWLATLAADQPLTFLDHRLVCGNSLLGAAPGDLLRVPAARARAGAGERQLPLFDPSELETLVHHVVPIREGLARTPDLTAAAVHEKESALARLEAHASVRRWRAACDIWTANCCAPRPVPAPVTRALLDEALHDRTALPDRLLRPARDAARQLAGSLRFLHWPLVFPEVFHDERGRPRPDAGFDAIVGNPPWEMLRADTPDRRSHDEPRACLRFARHSRLYTARPAGHLNQYQLFVDRALDLTRFGGRIGLVVPAGLAIDAGAAPLRQRLFHQCQLGAVIGFDNRAGLFPIHRSTRFLLVTATRGGRTVSTRCRFGLEDPAALEDVPDEATRGRGVPVTVTPALLQRLSGPDLAIPHLVSPADLRIAEKLAAAHPRLEAAEGWQARFARELNATDHKRFFHTERRGIPVLEGKHLTPYRVTTDAATFWIPHARAADLLRGARDSLSRDRLAFRDVAGATNRQTVIAAIVPAGCVTTHTLFCLRTALNAADARVLCALLNSYPVNFLVRQRISTHVTLAVMRTVPIPRPAFGSALHSELERRVRALQRRGEAPPPDAIADLQGVAALAFDLTDGDFEHVLTTFPLEPEPLRERALEAFRRERRRGSLR